MNVELILLNVINVGPRDLDLLLSSHLWKAVRYIPIHMKHRNLYNKKYNTELQNEIIYETVNSDKYFLSLKSIKELIFCTAWFNLTELMVLIYI